MAKIEIPYLVEKASGLYWQPSRAVRKLGFVAEALGTDREPALARAIELNRMVAERRAEIGDQKLPAAYNGTFNHLIDSYAGSEQRNIEPSEQWLVLSDDTRRSYQTYLNEIRAVWGRDRVSALSTEAAIELHEGKRATPYSANSLLRVLSTIVLFAMRKPSIFGLTRNPCDAVQKFGVKYGVKSRDQYWSADDEQRFLAVARETDPEIAMAFMLLLYTGQRPRDVLKMTRDDDKGDRIYVCQRKTTTKLEVAVHRDLRVAIDEHIERRHQAGRIGRAIVQGDHGGPLHQRRLGTRWDRIVRSAGIEGGLQRRDLRRTAVIRLSEVGATPQQIASVTGHTQKQVENILAMSVYWRATFAQSQDAIAKLESWKPRGAS